MSQPIWEKKLSRTDAQQPTSGGLVPYLRLTKGSLVNEDFQTWFRKSFFAGAKWQLGTCGKEVGIEEACVDIAVTINGKGLGKMLFRLTHGPYRCERNNTPNTWLHWPQKMQNILQNKDFSGRNIILRRSANGAISLEI